MTRDGEKASEPACKAQYKLIILVNMEFSGLGNRASSSPHLNPIQGIPGYPGGPMAVFVRWCGDEIECVRGPRLDPTVLPR